MSKSHYQVITGCAFVLAALILWAGLGGFGSIDEGASATIVAEWTPDLKPLDFKGEPIVANGSYPEVMARPLFSPTRRPPQARPPEPVSIAPPQPMAAAPPPAPPAEGFVLKGIFINDDRQLALLQTPAFPQGVWVARGAEVAGWTVSVIERQAITLEANGRVQKLALYVENPGN